MTPDAAAPGRGPAAPPPAGEVHAYQAEMQQLLNIIVHSLYSEREIFLRELISNASDALNKLKFETLTRQDVRDRDAALEITLSVDKNAPAVTVSDSGIGMTRAELIANLGTIARSGTLEWVKAAASRQAAGESAPRTEMIGQFGVGFYSVFMAAKRVVVDSCPADPAEPATRWVSEGGGSYELLASPRTRRGTEIRVELKTGAEEFSSAARVEDIVKRYSAFVPHPIRMDGRRLNDQEAIWFQAKSAVTEEQYREFYKFLTHDSADPLVSLHLSIDAPVQFRALLYIPPHLTNEVLYSAAGHGPQLYASRVLIQSECPDLLPTYLRFFRGVVDSEDLPLNVSREMVQKNALLGKLRTALTGRVLRELKALADADAARYGEFWHQYGKVMKEGVTADLANREKLLELARFASSAGMQSAGKDAGELTTLKEYVARMREGQKEILYFSGPSREAIERNPNLEFFRKHNLEVLYLSDRGVDDFMMAGLHEFEGKPFASIDNADLEAFKADAFKAEPPSADAVPPAELERLIGYLKETLGERVGGVIVSKRLVESPATLVNPDSLPGNLQKVMRMIDREFKAPPKTLELNPGHRLIGNMARLVPAAEGSGERLLLRELAEQLLDNCLLVDGQVEHPERMIARIQDFMTRASAAPPAGAAPAAESGGTPGPAGGGTPPLN
jgi:molecular chaperone HtpG